MDIVAWMIVLASGTVVLMGSIFAILLLFLLAKSFNARRNHDYILNAIAEYQVHMMTADDECLVDYTDMESYNATWLRLGDWGCRHILPKAKYELIKPYIRKGF